MCDSQAAVRALKTNTITSDGLERVDKPNELGKQNKVTLLWVLGHRRERKRAKKGARILFVGSKLFCRIISSTKLESSKMKQYWEKLHGMR